MCEILAPAGDKNSAMAAINSGADAIYLGLKQFSARSSADNFGYDELEEIVRYASLFGVKVHVAMNTLVKQDELADFLSAVKRAWEAGVAAVIIQDIFIGRAVHKVFPEITLHLSTQAGVCNEYGARLAKKFGFSRVILARETAFEDIKKITEIIETEVFVQGALCTCFSGQCYLSSFAGGNSGNRGKCKQPCRKLYSIDRRGFEERAYRLSPSDLSVGEDIVKLRDAGVYSFKIEGRMRRPEYVAAAVEHYRSLLGGGSGDISALRRTYNRGNYTKGLAFGQDKTFLSPAVQGHIGEYVGTVKVVGGRFFCPTDKKFVKGDGFKMLRGGVELCGAVYDGEGKGGFYVGSSVRLKNGDKVFITTDVELNARLVSKKRLLNVAVSACFVAGDFPCVNINGFEYVGEERLIVAQNRPLSEEDIADCFKKVGELPFKVKICKTEVSGQPYLGMGALNSFRRAAYSAFIAHVCGERTRLGEGNVAIPAPFKDTNPMTAVIAADLRGVSADIGILKPADYSADLSPLFQNFAGKKFLYLPAYLTGAETDDIKGVAGLFDGIYCEGFYGLELAAELGMPFFAGVGFNVSNTISASFLAENAKYFCVSKELTLRESAALSAKNAFCLIAGGIKVMDLVYCPFGRTCSACDRRVRYTLTDEAGRKFPLRRYQTSLCRFELYNCANLFCDKGSFGGLYDCTLLNAAAFMHEVSGGAPAEKLKDMLGAVTRGHSSAPVL